MTIPPVDEATCADLLDVTEWAEKHPSPPEPKRPLEYGEAAKTAAENLKREPFDYNERN